VIEDEVTRRVGPRHHPEAALQCVRWGQQPGYVMFAGQKVPVTRPHVRTRHGQEVELDSYARLQHDGRRQRAEHEGIVAGLTSWNYQRAVKSVLDGYGIEKSSVSREFVAASAAQLKKLCEKKLDGLDLVAILIDGIHLGKQVLVVALGIENTGKKRVLGLWQGATENTAVVKDLLEDLVTRRLSTERCYLFVIDGANALRAGIERVFGTSAEVQRCDQLRRSQSGARENLSATGARESFRGAQPGGRHGRNADGTSAGRGRTTATKPGHNQPHRVVSLDGRVARNVKRWHGGDQPLRWTATGLLEAERKFRKIKGFRELENLNRKLNPSLTQQVQVA
jgi:hypothetical protein